MSLSGEERLLVFKVAHETMRYEGTLLWQIFNVFLIIHTVFAGFLIQAQIPMIESSWRPWPFFGSIIGIGLCIPWLASYSRNAAHYRFHLARVRELEPPDWNLYGGEGRAFSSGSRIIVSGEVHKLSWLARHVRSGRMVPPVIALFGVVYAVILIATGPWWCGAN